MTDEGRPGRREMPRSLAAGEHANDRSGKALPGTQGGAGGIVRRPAGTRPEKECWCAWGTEGRRFRMRPGVAD